MRTLVLNAGYEPLAVISFRRALVLVLTGKASVIAEDYEDPVVGPGSILSRPSVILLHRYVRLPYTKAAQVSRRGVLRRDGRRCGYCGKAASTVDHIQPRSRGGADSWENLVACCLRCNNVKGNHTPSEMGWKLKTSPQPPRSGFWQLKELDKPLADWSPFLGVETAA